VRDPLGMMPLMTKQRVGYRCQDCGTAHPQWSGRCSTCEAWNSLIQDHEPARGRARPALGGGGATGTQPTVLAGVDPADARPRPTGVCELDRVLSGGVVPGSVTLLGGEPGVGKSTLLLQVLAGWPARTLYVTAEESAQQVRARASRLGPLPDDLYVLAETALDRILMAIADVDPTLVVVDSIQAIADPELGSGPGSVLQVRACAHALVAVAKAEGRPMILVGHVTKDGALAGPRVLEHVVDTVLSFEGERHHALRLLRAAKHRFGSTSELGLFEMDGDGLRPVPDAGRLFLADRRAGVAGSVVAPVVDGRRPLLVEVQALTVASSLGTPRRSTQGFDQARLSLLLAVLERRAGLPIGPCDVYASVVGGLRMSDPGGDLGVCVAVASSLTGAPVPADVVVCGEVGLAGEVRQVPQTPRRLAEAARLGFKRAIVPASACVDVAGIQVIPVDSVGRVLDVLGLSVGAWAGAN
jgi:DNA repair protein RadA/Sms